MKKIVCYSLIGLLIDQILKIIVESFLSLQENMIIIKNFFTITYVRNYGAAFSLLDGNRILFILLAFLAIFAFYILFIKNKNLCIFEVILYSFLLSGILGNLLDRIFRGYVVDYLSFTFFDYSFPVFNFADICIVIATSSILFFMWKEEYHGRNTCKSKGKKN